jgi:ankyrin repeat protein
MAARILTMSSSRAVCLGVLTVACLAAGALPVIAQFSPPPASLERLLQAARQGDIAGIRQALAEGAPIDAGDPRWSETALIRAAAFGQRESVAVLVKAGASPGAESAGGRTVLHAAAESGNADIIRDVLTLGVAVDHGAERGDTPLGVACTARQPSAIEALVAAGARHEALGSECGGLALLIMNALANDTGARDLPTIRAFIRARSGLNASVRDSGTPVQVVVSYCHRADAPEVARLLMDAGVDLRVKTSGGLTVVEEARRRLAGEPRCAATVAIIDREGAAR